MSLKNFVVKNGLTVGLANIDAATTVEAVDAIQWTEIE